MKVARIRKRDKKPLILTKPIEEMLKAIHFYRYMTARDVTHLLYSPSSLPYVRSILSKLSGGEDFKTSQYLYRFVLPSIGNSERVYTLGSRGRDFLANELGLPASWYFRPEKVRHFSHNHMTHNIILTRVLIASHQWSEAHHNFNLAKTRISYEMAHAPAVVEVTQNRRTEVVKVTPDAWLLFEKTKDGVREHSYPILLEIDRGTEYQQKFKQHVLARIEFIKEGGLYSQMFGIDAAIIAYVTTGDRPEYRETRRRAMSKWTGEALKELHSEEWASVFRFCSLTKEEIYNTPIFDEAVWYMPYSASPVMLFDV